MNEALGRKGGSLSNSVMKGKMTADKKDAIFWLSSSPHRRGTVSRS